MNFVSAREGAQGPVKPARFEYHAPTSVDEAVELLGTLAADDGRILAGGQSLVPTMAFRLAKPGHLIDINAIAALAQIGSSDGALEIGACVRHAAFHRPVVAGPLGQLLSTVVHHIAHYPIRQRGTFCGSLAHADPSSEWCLVAATLGAQMIALSTRGARTIAAEDYFTGIMTTALAEDELLTQVRIPLLAPDTRFGFREFSRRAGDYAIAMALVTFRLNGGTIVEPRIGIGGAEANPRRIPEAEAALVGKPAELTTFQVAAEIAAEMVEPMEDVQADATYRRDLVRAMTRRALEQAAQ
jgi:aerobic carbon-monoxide dehydrogenase medium subunit